MMAGPMYHLPHIGDMLRHHARVLPDKIGARDLDRAMTFAQWNARSCRLANALLGLATLAFPDRQVISVNGDGAFGINAMEIDTAVRHRRWLTPKRDGNK